MSNGRIGQVSVTLLHFAKYNVFLVENKGRDILLYKKLELLSGVTN